jgi:hypothetical protein
MICKIGKLEKAYQATSRTDGTRVAHPRSALVTKTAAAT